MNRPAPHPMSSSRDPGGTHSMSTSKGQMKGRKRCCIATCIGASRKRSASSALRRLALAIQPDAMTASPGPRSTLPNGRTRRSKSPRHAVTIAPMRHPDQTTPMRARPPDRRRANGSPATPAAFRAEICRMGSATCRRMPLTLRRAQQHGRGRQPSVMVPLIPFELPRRK